MLLANPVLKREFITSLRTKRALWLGLLALWTLAIVVLLMWPEDGLVTLSSPSSRRLFMILSLGFLSLVSLCAPSFTAVSITNEKERETFDLLYDTMLTPSEILTGKFLAGVGFPALLIFGSMAMMGACYILGGISTADVLMVYLIVSVAALFFGILGLYFSVIFKSSYRALILCYIAVLAISAGTWIPSAVLGVWAREVHAIHLVRALSPFAAMLSVVHPGMFSGEHPVSPGVFGSFADSQWPFIIFALVASLVLFILAYRKLAKPPQPRKRGGESVIEDRVELIKRHVKFPFYLLDPRKRKKMMGGLWNIIAQKEMRSKAFSRSIWMIRSMYICSIVALAMAFLPLMQLSKAQDNRSMVVFACISLPLGIIMLLSPVLTATAIVEERESGVFDMIRSTLISASTVVMGKLEVAWFFTILLLLSTFPTFFVLVFLNSDHSTMEHLSKGINYIRPFEFEFRKGWEELSQVDISVVVQLLQAYSVVLTSMFFATVVGIACSAWCKKSSTSTAISYIVVLILGVGTLIPALLEEQLPRWLVNGALIINPFTAAAKAASTADTFNSIPPTAWISYIAIIGGVSLLILFATIMRVHSLLRNRKY